MWSQFTTLSERYKKKKQWQVLSKLLIKSFIVAQKADPNSWIYSIPNTSLQNPGIQIRAVLLCMEQCSYGGAKVRKPWLQSYIQRETWGTLVATNTDLKSFIQRSLNPKSQIQRMKHQVQNICEALPSWKCQNPESLGFMWISFHFLHTSKHKGFQFQFPCIRTPYKAVCKDSK